MTRSRLGNAFSIAMVSLLVVSVSNAQVTPSSATPPAAPDDTPGIKLGATIFADYTYQVDPETTDADGNTINPNAFNVGRVYINFTGNLNHRYAFRITPDITRESGTGTSLNGSYVFRLKYAFAQLNLDDWMTKGSWARFGLQQTPYVDFAESAYRYRFQGTVFVDREGYLTASDLGASMRYTFVGNYGDVLGGYYNGEGYAKPEANDEKALQARVTVRPFPTGSAFLKGLRLTVFGDSDRYLANADKTRLIGAATYEHPLVNAGAEYLSATDQTSASSPAVDARGFSVWATPKFGHGWEALLRHDDLKPNTDLDARKKRNIVGVAYWIPNLQKVTSAVLLDYETVDYSRFATPTPDEKRIALHMLVNF